MDMILGAAASVRVYEERALPRQLRHLAGKRGAGHSKHAPIFSTWPARKAPCPSHMHSDVVEIAPQRRDECAGESP
jgi:hypothetical protein